MGWGKPFSKKGWLTKGLKIAAPIAAAFIPGVGPLAAAAIGAGVGSLGGKSGGGGLKGALIGGLTGGLGGLAKGGIASAGGLSGILGKAAGTPLSGGLQGATQGSGILGGLTRATSSLGSLGGVSKTLGTAGKIYSGANTLSSILGGGIERDASNDINDTLQNALANQRKATAPYGESGLAANKTLSEALASGRLGGQFTADKFQKDPGYEFGLAEGNKNLNSKLAASGDYFSGDAVKAAQEYGQDYASTKYQDAFERDNAEQNRLYEMLAKQQGLGAGVAELDANTELLAGLARAEAQKAKSNSLSKILSGFF